MKGKTYTVSMEGFRENGPRRPQAPAASSPGTAPRSPPSSSSSRRKLSLPARMAAADGEDDDDDTTGFPLPVNHPPLTPPERPRSNDNNNPAKLKFSLRKSLSFFRHSDARTEDNLETTSSTVISRHPPRNNGVDNNCGGRRNFSKSSTSTLFDPYFSFSQSKGGTPVIDSVTKICSAKAAEERKKSFRGSLPRSLAAAYDSRDCVAPFRPEEIVFGPKLGEGEFSNVFEIKKFVLRPDVAANDDYAHHVLSAEETKQRHHLKWLEKYRTTQRARYALKHIKENYCQENDSEKYVQAAGDLALEGELLSLLVHPNIIKLRGISYGGAAGFERGPSGYFLIIDRLFEVLDERIRRWHSPTHQKESKMRRVFTSFTKSGSANNIFDHTKVMDEQLDVAFQISAAVTYLHECNVICRDLKPVNIGFDVRGDVKLFDFGLARVMPESGDPHIDVFTMSGAGTPRYMAPECLRGEAYNMKADVYTFAILLWEILTGRTPYSFVKGKSRLIHTIDTEKVRPTIDESWPSSIQGMLESSFDSDMGKRPKMALWFDTIRDNIASLRGGDYSNLGSSFVHRRRSMESIGSRT